MSEQPTATFDPSKHMSKISGADYLEVRWRLVWFRDVSPNGSIETELVRYDEREAVVKATVTARADDGRVLGSGTSYGSEKPGDFRDYLEKAECVPLTVPILTDRGWKFYHQIEPGASVLGFDTETQQVTWTTVQDVSVYDATPVAQIGNSRFSAVCTPNHKWIVDGGLTPWDQRRGGGAERITLAAPLDLRGGYPGEAARVGWLMTDGQIAYRAGLPSSAEVRQSKSVNFDAINTLFGEASRTDEAPDRRWDSGRVSTVLPQRVWAVAADVVRRTLGRYGIATASDLPTAVLRMTRDEAAAFLDAAMAADGYGGDTFAKTNRSVVEAVQLAAFLTGRSSGPIRERSGNDMTTKPCLTVGIHKAGHKYTSEFRTTPLPPQRVWCPTTGTGTWVANFNGFIGITGNTKAIGRALATMGFGTQFTPDFDFGSDQGRVVDSPARRPSAGSQGQRPPSGNGQHPGGDRPATDPQRTFIGTLLRKSGMDMDSATKWCVDHGFTSETMTQAQASSLIDYLKPLAGYDEQTADDSDRSQAVTQQQSRAAVNDDGNAPTARQLSYLHSVAREAGLNDQQLAELITARVGRTIDSLDRRTVSQVIQHISELRGNTTNLAGS